MVGTGIGTTVIVWLTVVETPFNVTVQVYVVVVVGDTVMDAVLAPPGIQAYVTCPVLYNCPISCCVSARFQIPISSSFPFKNRQSAPRLLSVPKYNGLVELQRGPVKALELTKTPLR